MELLYVCGHFAPDFEGGTERVARAHAEALAARGHRVRVVAGTDAAWDGRERIEARVGPLEVVFLPRRPEEHFDLTLDRPRIGALLQAEAEGADLVHLHHAATLVGDPVRRLARGAPVVWTWHDHFATCPRFFRWRPDGGSCPEPEDLARGAVGECVACVAPDAPGIGPEVLAAGLGARLEAARRELAAAARVLVPSEAHRRMVAAFAGAAAAPEVLPHGLLFEPPAGPARPPRSPGEPLRVLHAGHRTRAKGTHVLVEALAAAPPGSVELILAGREVEPGYDDTLRAAAGGLALRWFGPFSQGDWPALAEGADLAAFPSLAAESYGLVVDEALALGLPVLVSDRGALPERIGGRGRVLPAGDPRAWRAALLELAADRASLARLAAGRAADLSGPGRTAERLEALYAALASRAR